MYKITSFDAWGSVDISLVCDDRDDMYTMWELDSGEIELGNIDCKFEKNPSEEEVEDIIERYAGVAEVVCDECMRVSGFLNQNERVVTKL